MKRIAILLAAVGLGSGCVVDTCPTGTLSVDWSFVDATGRSNLLCGDSGLSAAINDVDIYLDGVPVATFVPCTAYGASIADVRDGSHQVMVEGFDVGGNIIVRDWFTVSVQGCGNALTTAMPGEGIIKFVPSSCNGGPTYLTYSLNDVTRSPYVISAITPSSGTAITTFTCASGVSFPVPYGNYDLTKMEEVDSTGALVYASKCSTTPRDVLTWGTSSATVTWTSVGSPTGAIACTWP